MSVSKIATSAIMALSLVAVPTMASAAPAASKLSVTAPTGAVAARAGVRSAKGNKAMGGGVWIAILAAAAVIAGIIIAADNNRSPVSR